MPGSLPSGTAATTRDRLPLFERVRTAVFLAGGGPGEGSLLRTALLLHGNGVTVYALAPPPPDPLQVRFVSSLGEIEEEIDLVVCFPGDPGEVGIALQQAIDRSPRAVWLEPGVRLDPGSEALLEEAQIAVVRGQSLYAEYLSCYSCA